MARAKPRSAGGFLSKRKRNLPLQSRVAWLRDVHKKHPGLIRLTTRAKMEKRYGFPKHFLEQYFEGNNSTRQMRTKIELAQRVLNDPDRSWLAEDYRIWPFARVVALAPTHNAKDIYQTMLTERGSFPDASRRKILAIATIQRLIRTFFLRPDGAGVIWEKRVKKMKNARPDNGLSEEVRRELVHEAIPLTSASKNASEVSDLLLDRLIYESRKVKGLENLSQSERTARWRTFVRVCKQRWVIDALRKRDFQSRRVNPLKQKFVEVSELPSSKIPISLDSYLPSGFKLTPKDREVLDLLRRGFTKIQIARELGLTAHAITLRLFSLRKRISKASQKNSKL